MQDITTVQGFKIITNDTLAFEAPLFLKVSPHRIRMSKSTALHIGIYERCTVSFLNLGNVNEYFLCLDRDGKYNCTKISERTGFEIVSRPISRKINIVLGADCILKRTNYEFKGQLVYKIEKRIG